MAELSPAEETRAILSSCHAILENDHFVYCSGDHGSGWIDKDAVFPHTQHLERLGDLLAEAVRHLRPEVVCGPATGGLTVAQWTAHGLNAFCCFAEHGKADAKTGCRVSLACTAATIASYPVGACSWLTTLWTPANRSCKRCAVAEAGANIVGAAAFVNRGNVFAKGLGVEHFVYLLDERIPRWPAAECKLCHDGVRVNTHYAHGQEFVGTQLRA